MEGAMNKLEKPGDEGRTRERRLIGWVKTLAMLLVLLVAVSALVGGMVMGRWRSTAESRDRVGGRLPEFELVDQMGRTVRREDMAGKWLVVGFTYTGCSFTCLGVSRTMGRLQELGKDQPDLLLVSFSLDPRTDTPEVLRTFGETMGARAERWWFLTGKRDELYELIGGTFLDKMPPGVPSEMPGGFRNTERLALVDPDGVVRAWFSGMGQLIPDRILQTKERLGTP
jgi:protein SCO1/2